LGLAGLLDVGPGDLGDGRRGRCAANAGAGDDDLLSALALRRGAAGGIFPRRRSRAHNHIGAAWRAIRLQSTAGEKAPKRFLRRKHTNQRGRSPPTHQRFSEDDLLGRKPARTRAAPVTATCRVIGKPQAAPLRASEQPPSQPQANSPKPSRAAVPSFQSYSSPLVRPFLPAFRRETCTTLKPSRLFLDAVSSRR
jgi:hypothetical protein